MPRLYALILSGGAGTRLWPLSRRSKPKQFLPLIGERTLLQDTVDRVADRSGLGKGEAAKAVDAVLDSLQEVLSRGGEVNFTGFGKFTVADRSARQGVNPQTGEKIQIAASRVPRFSAGSQLKSAVKSGA